MSKEIEVIDKMYSLLSFLVSTAYSSGYHGKLKSDELFQELSQLGKAVRELKGEE